MLGYDAKGNLTSGNLDGSGAWAFGYDAENRMTSACKPAVSGTCPSPTVNASYLYDPLGRRVERSGTGVTKTWFVNDGTDEIAEYGSGNTPTVIYIPGPAIDEPVAMITGFGGTLAHEYFHTNKQGSVISMSDDAGNRVEGPFLYDPWGNCFQGSAPCAQLASSEPFKFTGRRLDPETGLYYYRARCYSPTLGRFCQTDPVGYTADLNLYTYGGNNPTNRTDPTGKIAGVDDAAEAVVLLTVATGAVIYCEAAGCMKPLANWAGRKYDSLIHRNDTAKPPAPAEPNAPAVPAQQGQNAPAASTTTTGSAGITVDPDSGTVHGDLPDAASVPPEDVQSSIGALDTSIGAREQSIRDHPPGDPNGSAKERRQYRQRVQHEERVRRERELRDKLKQRP